MSSLRPAPACHRSRFYHQTDRGFTLIEVMVVIVIASLMVGLIVFGFDQTLNRRKSTAVEGIYQWLQAAADTAVFQSTVVGVTQDEGELMLLAFYQDDWYRLANQEALPLGEEISFAWSESLTRNNQFHDVRRSSPGDDDRPKPYVVIMPSGDLLPEGEIYLFDSSLKDDNFRTAEQALAVIQWEDARRFELQWQSQQ